jgi:hypothetical protein
MIKFKDPKYGNVIIYEEEKDLKHIPSLTDKISEVLVGNLVELSGASVVGFRDRRKNFVKLLKNRYGPLEDFETEMFVLNYKEKIDIERLTSKCTICYCSRVSVDLERGNNGQILCLSPKCGAVYCLNDREREDIRIYLGIGFIDSRFDILDL